jgi:hypothetical protein
MISEYLKFELLRKTIRKENKICTYEIRKSANFSTASLAKISWQVSAKKTIAAYFKISNGISFERQVKHENHFFKLADK